MIRTDTLDFVLAIGEPIHEAGLWLLPDVYIESHLAAGWPPLPKTAVAHRPDGRYVAVFKEIP